MVGRASEVGLSGQCWLEPVADPRDRLELLSDPSDRCPKRSGCENRLSGSSEHPSALSCRAARTAPLDDPPDRPRGAGHTATKLSGTTCPGRLRSGRVYCTSSSLKHWMSGRALLIRAKLSSVISRCVAWGTDSMKCSSGRLRMYSRAAAS